MPLSCGRGVRVRGEALARLGGTRLRLQPHPPLRGTFSRGGEGIATQCLVLNASL